MMWIDTANKYLGAFASKDIEAIGDLLTDDVEFINNRYNVKGKDEVIEANRKFLDNIENIKVKIINTAYHNKYTSMELSMGYNYMVGAYRKILISHMVYIMEFNDWGKIKAIRIYEASITELNRYKEKEKVTSHDNSK